MQQHVKILGILNIVYGGLGVILGLFVFALLGGIAQFITAVEPAADPETVIPLVSLIGVFVMGLLFLLSAPSIIAGVGLLYYKPWARILTIVLSALHLLSIPFGTALGIYGLWVMLNVRTEALFRGGIPEPPLPDRPCA
jgi:hypothetical protein